MVYYMFIYALQYYGALNAEADTEIDTHLMEYLHGIRNQSGGNLFKIIDNNNMWARLECMMATAVL